MAAATAAVRQLMMDTAETAIDSLRALLSLRL